MLGMLMCIWVLVYCIEYLLKLFKFVVDENNSVFLLCILDLYVIVIVSFIVLSIFWVVNIELVFSIFFYFVE